MDNKVLAAINQKNKVDAMEDFFKTGSFPHPHDRIDYRMQIIKERVKYGLLITSKN